MTALRMATSREIAVEDIREKRGIGLQVSGVRYQVRPIA